MAQVAPSSRYRVSAEVGPELDVIRASADIEFDIAPGQRHLQFWVYPKRLEHPPAGMDEISARWIYPGEIDRGRFVIEEVKLDGRPVVGAWRAHRPGHPLGVDKSGADYHIPLTATQQGRKARISIKFRFQVPARFGRLGHAKGRLSLAAPWYPLLLDSRGAFQSDAFHDVHFTAPLSHKIYAASKVQGRNASVRVRGDYVPLMVAPTFHQRTEHAGPCSLRFVSSRQTYQPPPPNAPGVAGLKDTVRIDTPGLAREVLAEVCMTLRDLKLPLPKQMDILEVPSRTELVGTAPGVVLVSDRLLEIFPLAEAQEFHRSALRQVLFIRAVQPWSDVLEAPLDRGWSAEVRAHLLTEYQQARRLGGSARRQKPSDLLGFAAFHPAVDQLLYAPQVAFEEAFFNPGEVSPFRDDPVHARVPWAHGARVLESARMVMTRSESQRLARLALDQSHSVRAAIKEISPQHTKRLGVWLTHPLRPVNYRLGSIRSKAHPKGGYQHYITIVREGAVRPEPVPIKITDDAGNVVWGRWTGDRRKGTVVLKTKEPLEDVELDPQHRLAQSSKIANGHPRADDATSHPWRPPLLQAFSFGVLLPDFRVQAYVDFALRKRYNLEQAFGFTLGTDPGATEGSVRYEHGFGPKVHDNRRVATAVAGLGFSRLHSDFAAGEQGGWRGTVWTGASMSTRRYLVDPRTGSSLGSSISLSGVDKDSGGFGWTFSAGMRGNLTLPIGLKNALVLVGGIAGTVNPVLDADRQALGGRFLLRAFQPDELLGDARGFVVLEHRWTAVSDLSWNLLHLAWLRELQVAWFAGSGVIYAAPEGSDWQGAAEVGGGVRFMFDYGGVQPGLLALDLAVPLTRQNDALVRNGEVVRRYSPLSFYISFDQYF